MPAASPEPGVTAPAPQSTPDAPILVLDAASGQTLVAIVDTGGVLAERTDGERGAATERLPDHVAALLAATRLTPSDLTAIAVTIGPGSFTGLRAALALAHGFAHGAGVALIGVGVGEALRASVASTDGRPIWVALDSRRGRVFLDRDGRIEPFAPAELPSPDAPITLAGDAAGAVVALLASRGADARLDPMARASARGIAAVARLRLSGRLPPLDAVPLYIDPPEAKLPAGGLRPAPV